MRSGKVSHLLVAALLCLAGLKVVGVLVWSVRLSRADIVAGMVEAGAALAMLYGLRGIGIIVAMTFAAVAVAVAYWGHDGTCACFGPWKPGRQIRLLVAAAIGALAAMAMSKEMKRGTDKTWRSLLKRADDGWGEPS